MSDKPMCGAQAWREFTYEGLLFESNYRSTEVTCTFKQGHSGQHSGWCRFKTALGPVTALVTW